MGKFVVRHVPTGIKFDLKAGNGEVILTSAVYTTKNSCLTGIRSVMRNAPAAGIEDQTAEAYEKKPHPKFELYQDRAGEYRFRLKAKNGQLIAVSEGYVAKANCEKGILSVKKNAAEASIAEA